MCVREKETRFTKLVFVLYLREDIIESRSLRDDIQFSGQPIRLFISSVVYLAPTPEYTVTGSCDTRPTYIMLAITAAGWKGGEVFIISSQLCSSGRRSRNPLGVTKRT